MSQLRLTIGSMSCRHCVREVTGWLRDVPGVETVTADARTGTVELGGSMSVADVLAVFAGSNYSPQVLEELGPRHFDRGEDRVSRAPCQDSARATQPDGPAMTTGSTA